MIFNSFSQYKINIISHKTDETAHEIQIKNLSDKKTERPAKAFPQKQLLIRLRTAREAEYHH